LLLAVMSVVVACTVPSGSSLDPSASVEATTTSNEPSAPSSADPGPVWSHDPSPDPTPDLARSVAPPAFRWRRHVLPGLAYQSVLEHRGRFIALGPDRADLRDEFSVLESDDGLTWRTLVRRPFDGQIPLSMTLVGERLIVIAWRILGPESAEKVVWRSDDGKAWEIWMDGASHPESFARIGDRWLMLTEYGGGIQSSLDGTDWTTELPLHAAAEGAGLTVGPAGVLAPVTQEGQDGPGRSWMYLSLDGTEWTEGAFEDAADTFIAKAAANDAGYVAIGLGSYQTAPSTSRAWWSADGATWQRAVVPDLFWQSRFYPNEIVSYGSGFLVTATPEVEGPDRMLWTGDGRAWDFVEGGPDLLYEGTGLVVDGGHVLWYGYELTDPEVRTLWEAVPTE
jgi:hypothetical protein